MELNMLNIFFNFFENVTRLAKYFKFIFSARKQFEFQTPGLEQVNVNISKSTWSQMCRKC
jgi:hypothetical protein